MYGKFFTSTFSGSMFGAGEHVFAVWGYVIASAVDGAIELNPPFVAAVLGTTAERVTDAIAYLCQPDPKSRSLSNMGRRLAHEGGFQYRVINHAKYRAIRNEEDRRAYNREAQRRHRAKQLTLADAPEHPPVKSQVVEKTPVIPSVIDSQSLSALSAHTEAETETEVPPYSQAVLKPERTSQPPGEHERVASTPPPAGRRPQGPSVLGGAREHRTHALCGRVCLPTAMFEKLVRFKGGPELDAHTFVRAWAAAVLDAWGPGGPRALEPPGASEFDFWRDRWHEDFPVAKVARTRKTTADDLIAQLARQQQQEAK